MLSSIAASLGTGSGIDTNGLINDLAAASRTPKIRRFEALAQTNQARISAIGQAQSDLDSFASSLAEVVAGTKLRAQPVISDNSILSASIAGGVRLSGVSATLEISQLAQSQTIFSGYAPNSSDPIGQGVMSLSVGGASYSILVGANNDSMTGLAAAINASGSSVRASIVTDNNGSRLIMKSESGANNSFTLTATSGGDPGLNRYTFGGGSSAMILGQSAADAQFRVDGVSYSRPSNDVNDVIGGVSLSLKLAKPGSTVTLSVTRPLDGIRETIDDFVNVFNSVKTNIAAARTATGGDYALRKLDQQFSALIGSPVTSNAMINSLSDIGIATGRDGKISINKSQLEAALAADPGAVEALFNPTRDAAHTAATDPGISAALTAIKDTATQSDGIIDSLRKRLNKQTDAISINRAKTEAREDDYRVRLEKQFGSMDTRIAALKATQSYLEQQIKIWNSGN